MTVGMIWAWGLVSGTSRNDVGRSAVHRVCRGATNATLLTVALASAIVALSASSAAALVDSEPIYKDVEITRSALAESSTLSDFAELSAEEKLAVERVFGTLEWQNELYRGGSAGEIDSLLGPLGLPASLLLEIYPWMLQLRHS